MKKTRSKPVLRRTVWNNKKDDFLIANYSIMPIEKISQRIGKTIESIRCRVFVIRKQITSNKVTRFKDKDVLVDFMLHRAKVKWRHLKKEPEKVVKMKAPEPVKTRPRMYANRIDTSPKRVVMIDHRTAIYVDASLSESQVQKIKSKYKPLPR